MGVIGAGELRDRCDLVRVDHQRDQLGTPIGNETTIAGGVWCKVEPLAGSAAMVLSAGVQTVTIRVTIRWRELPPPGRLTVRLFEGDVQSRSLRVEYITRPRNRRDLLELNCSEVTP